jgi:PIN domain nuclease of toxin-antitoxin system
VTRVLFDTHVFLWMMQGYEQLSPKAVELIENPHNEWFLSVASLWEITIKAAKGHLEVTQPISKLIEESLEPNRIQLLQISPLHFNALYNLPLHHRDPFDRLIIAQAQVDSLTLLSKDRFFPSYEVDVVW